MIVPEKSNNNPQNALVASPNGTDDEDEGDIVPRESLDRSRSMSEKNGNAAGVKKKKGWFGGFGGGSGHAKEERVLKKYWRFVGFKDEPRVRALLEAHHAKLRDSKRRGSGDDDATLLESHSVNRQGSIGSIGSGEVQHGPATRMLSFLGTGKRSEHDRTPDRALTPSHGSEDMPASPRVGTGNFSDIGASDIAAAAPSDVGKSAKEDLSGPPLVAPKPKHGVAQPLDESEASASAPAPSAAAAGASSAAPSSSDSKPEMPKLERIDTVVRKEMEESAKSDGLKDGDFKLADALANTHMSRGNSAQGGAQPSGSSKLEEQLGPWRFADPGTDMIEDNAFIFTTQSLPVPRRRKHFASEKNRLDFHYDPDVVYGASFFTDAMDFNTFGLGIGPVKLNVARFFTDMPVRYTLRSTKDENLTFATISFQLVD